MKSRILFLCLAVLIGLANVFAQTYTSVASGDWDTPTTWDQSAVPGQSDVVVIASGHTVTLGAAKTIDGSLTINGTLKVDAGGITAGTGTITVANGGTYQHNINSVTIPTMTWQTGSTFLMTAAWTAGNTASGGNQNYYNIIWNAAAGQSSNVNLGLNGATIGGDITCISTGTGRFQLGGGTTTITVNGNINVSGGNFALTGASSSNVTLNVNGNITVTGGNFGLTRNSASPGVVNLTGNLSVSNATVQNSQVSATTSRFVFVGSGSHTVTMTNVTYSGPISYEVKDGGTVNLSSDLIVGTSGTNMCGQLTLTNGNIVTGSNKLVLGISASTTPSNQLGTLSRTSGTIIGNFERWFATGTNSNFLFPIGTASNYRPVTITTASVTTGGKIMVSYTDGTDGSDLSPTLDDGAYTGINRRSNMYWTLTGTTIAGGTYDISIDANGQSGIGDATEIRLINSTDGSTFSLVGTHSPGAGTVFSRTGISIGIFDRFYLAGKNPPNPLPVELTSFTAVAGKYDAMLNWKVATEVNAYGYEVLRREVGKDNIANVGFVRAEGKSEYSYNDVNVKPGNYIYELRQVDNDGTFKIYSSSQVTVGAAVKELTLGSYPNPFNPMTNIEFTLPENGFATLKVYNIIGQEVATLFSGNVEAGIYTKVQFNASQLSSGMYFSVLEAGNQRLVKKLMLTK